MTRGYHMGPPDPVLSVVSRNHRWEILRPLYPFVLTLGHIRSDFTSSRLCGSITVPVRSRATEKKLRAKGNHF